MESINSEKFQELGKKEMSNLKGGRVEYRFEDCTGDSYIRTKRFLRQWSEWSLFDSH